MTTLRSLPLVSLAALLCLAGCDRSNHASSNRRASNPADKASPPSPPAAAPTVNKSPEKPAPTPPVKAEPALPAASIGPAVAGFGSDLYAKESAKLKPTDNFVLSPMSVYVALAMTRAGAGGDTAKELNGVLHLPPTSGAQAAADAIGGAQKRWTQTKKGVTLAIANRMFAAETLPLQPSFVDLSRKAFGSEVKHKPFATQADKSRKEINLWVQEQTRDRIKDLLAPGTVRSNTKMVLINAIWFKGDWANPFDKASTKARPFLVDGKRKKRIPTMQMVDNLRVLDASAKGYRAVDLPYADERLSMTFILPQPKTDLSKLESSLDFAQIGAEIDKSPAIRTDLQLPRFTIQDETSLSLTKTLSKMGMSLAFNSAKADFSPITGGKVPLAISDVIHKAMIIVNEEGAEAAAATGVVMYRTAFVEPTAFHINRPFLFFIRDRESQAVLFAGRIVDPVNPKG